MTRKDKLVGWYSYMIRTRRDWKAQFASKRKDELRQRVHEVLHGKVDNLPF